MTDVTLNNITSGYNIAKVNDNFQKIEDSINNDLINRSGGNNTMAQDFDMNSNNLLNVENIDVESIKLNGLTLAPETVVVTDAVLGSDLASTASGKGSSLVGFRQAGAGSVDRTVQDKVRDFVSVLDKGADPAGLVDSTVAFNAALAMGKKVFVPAGTYILNVTTLPSGAYIYGEGDATVLKPLTNTQRAVLGCDSGSATAFIYGITLRDMKLVSTSDTDGFYEQAHLMSLNGISNCLIERVSFVGFRGDGLYLGSSDTAGLERHNIDVTVRKCVFDGINKANRNGISVIDCDGLAVENCQFYNTTSSSMPGAIDIEPNAGATYAIIKNIAISNCKFTNIGGNYGVISVNINGYDALVNKPLSITVEGCKIVGYSGGLTGAGFIFKSDSANAFGLTSSHLDIRLLNNTFNLGTIGRNFSLLGGRGYLIKGNTFIGGLNSSLIGYTGTGLNPVDVSVIGNTFLQAPLTQCYSASYVVIDSNKIIGGTSANAIAFSSGASDNISITNNKIVVAGSSLTTSVHVTGHTFNQPTNSFYGNDFGSLANDFLWNKGYGQIAAYSGATAYQPVVHGGTSSGAVTYTTQTGQYCTIGNVCYFQGSVVWSSNSSTGDLIVRLPVPASSTKNAAGVPLAAIYNGPGVTAGQQVLGALRSNFNDMQFYISSGTTSTILGSQNSGSMTFSGSYFVD